MANSKKNIYCIVIGVLIILFLAAAGAAVYFYKQATYFAKQFNELKLNPQKFIQEETQNLIERVGKLVVLPEGEQPTIATVNDPELLKNQPFFANAKKGDKVLIYTNAKKAILYDPVNNKIIEIAPINIGSPQSITP